MIGITLAELQELLSHSHEAEFVYRGIPYVIQPELSDGKAWLVIWDCSDNGECICKHEIPKEGDIPQEIIQKVLSEKCFNGQSFFEVEADITVDTIF